MSTWNKLQYAEHCHGELNARFDFNESELGDRDWRKSLKRRVNEGKTIREAWKPIVARSAHLPALMKYKTKFFFCDENAAIASITDLPIMCSVKYEYQNKELTILSSSLYSDWPHLIYLEG